MGMKKKNRGAKFAEGERVFNFSERQAMENGGYPPEGVVLRATRKGDKWCYLVQLTGTDQLVTRREDELSPLEVEV